MDDRTNESEIRKLNNLLRTGIRSVLLSENFKNYLETQSRFYSNNYSLRNTLLIQRQIPDPTYVMGAEDWKRYGRQVTDDATAALIFIPRYLGKDRQYLDRIKYDLQKILSENPRLDLAKKKIGNSDIEFTLQKNGIWGVTLDGRNKMFSNEGELRKFYWKNVANKLPQSYIFGNVFDVKDTVIPQYLWVKRDFSDHETVKDDDGNPIRNEQGEFKIKNSAERIFRFVDKLDYTVPKNDEAKMLRLHTALKNVCKSIGVSVQAVDRETLDQGKDGCDGTYDYQEKRIRYANDLPIEKQNAVLFHELAHANVHSDLRRLAGMMGIDKKEIDYDLMEVQAEATAYLTAKRFGIETETGSFNYLASYTRSLDLRGLEKSLNVIHDASKALLNHIENELIKSGYNLSMEPISVTEMNQEQLKTYASRYASDAVIQRSAEYADILKSLAGDYQKASGAEKDNIEDQIRCVRKINEDISEAKALLHRLHNTAIDDKTQIVGIIERLDSILSDIRRNEEKYNYLLKEHKDILSENDNHVSDFLKDPMKVINRFRNLFEEDGPLSKHETDYIALSKVIGDDYSYLLRNDRDIPLFAAAARQRAFYINDIAAANGVFVEINSMEHFDSYNRPVFSRGELCHPKYADTVIQEAEQSIRRLKAAAKEKNEYHPYSKCDLTIYTRKPDGGLNALHTSIDIGDSSQAGLTDHLQQCCKDGLRKEIFKAYNNALNDFIWEYHAVPKIPSPEEFQEYQKKQSAQKNGSDPSPQHEISVLNSKCDNGKSHSKPDISEGV